MSEHELDKLLGGFAADTLTPEERQKLFTAALQDQQLFNALADEQALRDLLADPVVRRRLIQALNQTGASGAGGSLSWLDWLRRPATLAYAGGLAVAVFAVVLGTKVYQESLRQTALTVATEDTKAAAPPSATPQASQPAESPATVEEPKANVNVGPAAEPTKKGLSDKLPKRERAAAPPLQDQRPPHAARDDLRQKAEPDKTRRNVEPPVAALGKSAEKATAPAPEIHANTPTSGTGAPAVGARALFYAEPAARSDGGTIAQEQARAMKPSAESAAGANQLERKMDRFALARKAPDISTQSKPLGLRYGFVIRETNGQDREVDATTAANNRELLYLAVEPNQDAYLQIWQSAGPTTPQLLFPEKESGQISSKILARQRQLISVPTASGTITVRLSRMPFGPISRQEAIMLGRSSPGQIQETVTAGTPTAKPEQATYVVNQDLSSTAQIAVQTPLDR